MRNKSSAAFKSPPVSVSAFLHSIMPKPVNSRNSFTMPAVISAISNSLNSQTGELAVFHKPAENSTRKQSLGDFSRKNTTNRAGLLYIRKASKQAHSRAMRLFIRHSG